MSQCLFSLMNNNRNPCEYEALGVQLLEDNDQKTTTTRTTTNGLARKMSQKRSAWCRGWNLG